MVNLESAIPKHVGLVADQAHEAHGRAAAFRLDQRVSHLTSEKTGQTKIRERKIQALSYRRLNRSFHD